MTSCLQFLLDLDIALFYFLNGSLQNAFFDILMPVLTNQRNWYIPLGLLWIGLLVWGGRKGRTVALLMIPLITLADQTSSHVLKPLIQRSRPCNVLGSVHLYKDHQWMLTPEAVTQVFKSSFSFPSSHATNIFAGGALLSYTYRRWMPVFLVIASCVAYSRVYIGIHYPSDILGGALLGIGYGLLVAFLWKWLEQRIQRSNTQLHSRK